MLTTKAPPGNSENTIFTTRPLIHHILFWLRCCILIFIHHFISEGVHWQTWMLGHWRKWHWCYHSTAAGTPRRAGAGTWGLHPEKITHQDFIFVYILVTIPGTRWLRCWAAPSRWQRGPSAGPSGWKIRRGNQNIDQSKDNKKRVLRVMTNQRPKLRVSTN